MKHLSKYKIFESTQDIDAICYEYNIEDYTINKDRSIDVDGNVDLSEKNLTEIPLKFNRVSGFFNCNYNILTSLEGSPNYVGSSFTCYESNLTSLEGSPKYVGGYFNCRFNKIISLEGCPEHIGSDIYCDGNPIYSIIRHFIGSYTIINGVINRDKRNNLIELFNYYDIVQDKNVIYDRLKYFYEGIVDIGGYTVKVTTKMLREIENNGYKIIK